MFFSSNKQLINKQLNNKQGKSWIYRRFQQHTKRKNFLHLFKKTLNSFLVSLILHWIFMYRIIDMLDSIIISNCEKNIILDCLRGTFISEILSNEKKKLF
jgi:hypothetical protein